MEDNVNKELCDEKMKNISDKLSDILSNTTEIKEKVAIIPLLCERVTALEKWKDGFWKSVIATMLGAIAIFSGIVAILNKFRN